MSQLKATAITNNIPPMDSMVSTERNVFNPPKDVNFNIERSAKAPFAKFMQAMMAPI